MRSRAAFLETFKEKKIEAAIAIQRKTISISAKEGELSPKKSADQRKLRKSWTAKKKSAVFLNGDFFASMSR